MFKKEILVLYYGLQDKRTGLWPKLTFLLAVIYLLSPIDLVPDFIPVVGYLDDLVLVPLLLNLAVFLLPGEVKKESLTKASHSHKKLRLTLIIGIILMIAAFMGIFFLIRYLINMK